MTVELHVEAPEEVTEGETADLTCKTTCSLTDPTSIWYKDGRPLTTKTIKNNQLHLQTVSSEDAGSYSCAVRGDQHLRSTAHRLRVRYPPKRVSVSIRPSGEIVEGSSVTLTCSSDANPPVKIYTWFKEGGTSPVGSGHSYSIISITADHTGLYYCEAKNEHGALNGTVMVFVKSRCHVSLPGSSTSIMAVAPEALMAHTPPLLPSPSVSPIQTAPLSGLQPGTSVPQRRDPISYADFLHSVSALPEDDVLYTNVTHSTSRPAQAADSADSGAADVLYATVMVQKGEVTSTDQQGEPQYASVTFLKSTAAPG
ncbi:hypothetical protein MHYP_G00102530 [Metynnis hypsauchen]